MLNSLSGTDGNLTPTRQLTVTVHHERGRRYDHKFIIRSSCATVLIIPSSFHIELEIPP